MIITDLTMPLLANINNRPQYMLPHFQFGSSLNTARAWLCSYELT